MSLPPVQLNIYTCVFTVKMAHTGVQLQAVWGVILSQELVTCKLAHTYTGPHHALWDAQKILVYNIVIHHTAEGEGDRGKDENHFAKRDITRNHQQGDEQGWCSGKQIQAKFVYVITESYHCSNHCVLP